jgi:hypothetical protein
MRAESEWNNPVDEMGVVDAVDMMGEWVDGRLIWTQLPRESAGNF